MFFRPGPHPTDSAHAAAADHVEQATQDALTIGAQTVVGVLVGDPGAQPKNATGGLLGKGSLHVDIVDVHGCRNRDRVAGETVGVVQARPCMPGQDLR